MASTQAYRKQKVTTKGELWTENGNAYWVPSSREPGFNSGDFGSADKLRELAENHEEVIVWEKGFTGSDAETRGQVWAKLMADSGYGGVPFARELFEGDVPKDPRVPLSIAQEGKARIAAWLFCHNVSYLKISHRLDVGERTVKQYVSDVKRGER
jgi:hypothetical protein